VWAVLVILLGTYFVLDQVGLDAGAAALWAPSAAGLVAVVLLWRAAHNREAPAWEPVGRSKLARRVLALAILTYLSVALVSGLVGGFGPEVPPGGSPDHAIAVSLRLGTTVQLPITLILVFGVGRLSARWLTVRRPFRWLAIISVIPAAVSLALRPVTIALADNYGATPPRDLADNLPRMVAVTVLIFCVLALGNLYGRKSARQPAPARSSADGGSPAIFSPSSGDP
jgi:hypothetical protein